MNDGRLLTAMVTPFNDKGEVCFERTTAIVEHLIENKTEGLVVAGTTGESPTLSNAEKLKLFEQVVKITDGRVPVIAGTGSNNTKSTIEFSKETEALGVDGIMIVAPYYSKPNQSGLYQHFKTIAENIKLPIMIYNIPGRSSVNITPDTIIELSKIDNITSVKEASGSLDQMAEIIAQTADDFVLYSGDDGLTLPALSIGGQGVVSVASHLVGGHMSKMIEAFLAGDHRGAAKDHLTMLPLMRAIFAAPSPVPVKTLLNQNGVEAGGVRLPMLPLNEDEHASLNKVYEIYLQKVK
ncbi:dihydrodipicolinate synthase [Scopulibacillus darangshiensis]|uniref:4-hydroxy-tetrahydrodipicolinate synthase n=1 Tax=Scopulibacillus darangshiensis TaxID=442528 RepID=A0A4R2P5Y5_9BACL|nr:4-hydroxy-tetrahydrodipicolinate synthase [Scopulibacillus darangshiensis]TCP30279.1 dihydrodipicolinate synthase [Scopulibacillus darangshiensis]